MAKKSSKRYGIRNIHTIGINVQGLPLAVGENRMVNEDQEIKNLIAHGYIKKVTDE
jgi:hypothetical protein